MMERDPSPGAPLWGGIACPTGGGVTPVGLCLFWGRSNPAAEGRGAVCFVLVYFIADLGPYLCDRVVQ